MSETQFILSKWPPFFEWGLIQSVLLFLVGDFAFIKNVLTLSGPSLYLFCYYTSKKKLEGTHLLSQST